jgi:hypothetical protein
MGIFEKLFGSKKKSTPAAEAGTNDTSPPAPSKPPPSTPPAAQASAAQKQAAPPAVQRHPAAAPGAPRAAQAAAGGAMHAAVPSKLPAAPVHPPAPAPQAKKPHANGNGHGAHGAGHSTGHGTGDFVDEIIAALDATFTGGTGATGSQDLVLSPAAEDAQAHKASVDALFAEIAATYAKPIRDFMIEVQKGTATKEWMEICVPALKSIGQAARSMHLEIPAARMDELEAALKDAVKSGERQISGTLRDNILARYQRVTEAMPQAFAIRAEAPAGKDGIIITSLLKQIPEVSRLTLDKIFTAGLTSMDTFLKATPKELSQATGIAMGVAELICQKIKQYKADLAASPAAQQKPDKKSGVGPQDAYLQRLLHLNSTMRRAHEAFERANEGNDEGTKRRLRGERKNCAFQISIVLAELGEVALVKELEKLPFERRIQIVDEYIARAAKK